MTTPIPMNTHILAEEFELHQPTTVDEAVALLAQYNGQSRVLAGGTDLLVKMKMEHDHAEQVVYIGKIKSLRGIHEDADGVTFGSLTTFYDLQQSALIREKYRGLSEGAHSVSGTQIKIMGSIGGNLCNASPASDSAPALLVHDAQVELTSSGGARWVALAEFFTGPGQTVRAAGELLTAIKLAPSKSHEGSAFLKLGRVAADIAKVSAAVRIVRNGDAVADCRVALGSVGPTPLRIHAAESHVAGSPFSLALAESAGQIASAAISPISDVRSTAEYRRRATSVLVRDALLAAWERAGD